MREANRSCEGWQEEVHPVQAMRKVQDVDALHVNGRVRVLREQVGDGVPGQHQGRLEGGVGPLHHYQHHIGDYSSHTAHLSPLEDIAYRRMLDLYYLHERPFNGRSTDVARLIRMGTHQAEVEVVLKEFFRDVDGVGWVNDRAEEEIEAYKSRRDSAVKAGKVSGKVRRQSAKTQSNDRSTTVQRPFNGTGTNVEPTGNQYPVPVNQEPEERDTPPPPKSEPRWFPEFWKAYAYAKDKPASLRAWAKIRPDEKLAAEIIAKAGDYVRATPDKQFRAHPATWLNRRGWEDELPTTGPSLKPAEPPRNFLPDALKPAIVMHNGDDPDCQCETCCRNRRNVSIGILNDLSTRRKA